MLCLSMALISCSSVTTPGPSRVEIYVHDSIRHPVKYKYQNREANKYGIYECGSELYKCITYQDEAILKINIKSLLEAHKSTLFLIDEHNSGYSQDEMEDLMDTE